MRIIVKFAKFMNAVKEIYTTTHIQTYMYVCIYIWTLHTHIL